MAFLRSAFTKQPYANSKGHDQYIHLCNLLNFISKPDQNKSACPVPKGTSGSWSEQLAYEDLRVLPTPK